MFKIIEVRKIRELAASINKNGLLNPITVERTADGFYEVVAGHRRFQAIKLLNEPSMECNVLEFITEWRKKWQS